MERKGAFPTRRFYVLEGGGRRKNTLVTSNDSKLTYIDAYTHTYVYVFSKTLVVAETLFTRMSG